MSNRKLKDFLTATYLPQKDASEMIKNAYGYTYDPNLSTMETKVFLNPGSNEAIIGFRGSKRVEDWISHNAPLAVGMQSETRRFKQAKSTLQKIQEQYPGFKTISVGHSLGGSIAKESGADKSITYNRGIGLGDIGQNISPNETFYRSKYDPVSTLSFFVSGKKHEYETNAINPLLIHSVSNMPEDIYF